MKRSVTYRLYKKTKTNVINTSLSFMLLASSLGGTLPLILSQKAFADTTVTVTQASPSGWLGIDDNGNGGSLSYSAGPATPPLGNGSAQLEVTSTNQGYLLYKNAYGGTRLADVSNYMYSTYVQTGNNLIAPSAQINIDKDVTDADTSYQGRLVYEPYMNGSVQDGQWQTWNAASGKWWLTKSATLFGNNCGQGSPCTFGELTALYPDMGVASGAIAGLGFKAGSSWSSFKGNVDAFSFNTDAYDFEPVVVPACSADDTTFDTFGNGSVNGQNGWQSTGSYDQAIVDNTYGFNSFGCKSLRLSNAVASGSFGDQTFSYSTANEAGESDSTSNGQSGGTRQNHYEAQFDVASTSQSQQTSLSLSVAPDRGDGSRMSYLRLADQADGIHVFFVDVQGTTSPSNFVETEIATLSRTAPHTLKFAIDYVNGPSNDIVKVYVDGSLVHTGTTWENYYRYDSESSAEQSPRTSDSLLFRAGGAPVPANSGKGLLFDNVNITTSTTLPPATPTNLRFENPSTVCGGYTNINFTSSTWDAVTGAVGYDYHVEGPNGLVYNANVVGTSNSGSFGAGVEGTYSFQVRSVNSLGQKSAWSPFCSITYDHTAPTALTQLTPPNNSVVSTNDFYFTWTGSTDTNPVTYEFQSSMNPHTTGGVLDTGVWNNIANGNSEQSHLTDPKIHSTGAPDGDWYWQVRAIDAAGNKSAWTSVWKATIDSQAPAVPTNLSWKTTTNVTVADGGATKVVDGTASWQDSSSDVDHYVYKYWNDIPGNPYKVGSEYATTVGGTSLPGVFNQGEGVHHFCVQAVDGAGNTSACSAPFTITYDVTKPVVNLTSPAPNAINPTSLSVSATDNVALNKVTANIYDETNTTLIKSCSASATPAGTDNYVLNCPISGLADGTYTIRYNANDTAGSVSTTKTSKFVIDHTAPTGLANVSPADGTTTTTAAQQLITWTAASDTNGPVSYFYESSTSDATNPDGSFVSAVYQSSALTDHQIPTPGTSAGTYFWHVRAVDAAGNTTAWTGPWKIVIDNTAPAVTVDTLSTNDTTPTVTGTVDDSTATVNVTVNGHTYAATVIGNNWSADVTDALTVNTYDVVVAATDTAGNTGNDSTANELKITAVLGATTGPVVVSSSSPQNANTGNTGNSGNGSAGDAQDGDAADADAADANASVLGASTGADDSDSAVKNFADVSAKNAKFLGLGWWWLLIIAAVAGFFWFILAAKRRNDDEKA
jgi:hypothetical protein